MTTQEFLERMLGSGGGQADADTRLSASSIRSATRASTSGTAMPTVRRSPEVPHDYPYEELGAVLDANRLRELESLLASASGDRWDLDEDENGLPGIRVHFADGHAEHLRATREDRPAGRHDVELIARGRQDLERLIRCLRGELSLPDGELGAIERRLAAASPGP